MSRRLIRLPDTVLQRYKIASGPDRFRRLPAEQKEPACSPPPDNPAGDGDRWPDEPVLTPRQFGQRWCDLASGFVEQSQALGALLVRYEDLRATAETVGEISDYTGMNLRPEILEKRVAGRGAGTFKPQKTTASEIRALAKQVEPLASRLGYGP